MNKQSLATQAREASDFFRDDGGVFYNPCAAGCVHYSAPNNRNPVILYHLVSHDQVVGNWQANEFLEDGGKY